MEQEVQHEADLANMTEQQDAHLDGLVTMSWILSSRIITDLLTNNVSAEVIHDAMSDVAGNIEDVGEEWDDDNRQELMFGSVGSRLGATLSFTIPRVSTARPGPTTPKRPRTLNWYRENFQHSNRNSNSLTSQQVNALKNKIIKFQNIIDIKTQASPVLSERSGSTPKNINNHSGNVNQVIQKLKILNPEI